MPREPEPQGDEEILEKPPSHPITTILLVVCAVALVSTIVLAWNQLGFYVNKATKKDIEANKSMEAMLDADFPPPPTAEEAAAGAGPGAATDGGEGTEPSGEPASSDTPSGEGEPPAPSGEGEPGEE